nr:nucleotidyltransferase family protein [Motiliproteus sediminis]
MIRFLAHPDVVADFSAEQWSLFVRQADGSALWPYAIAVLKQYQLIDQVPEHLRWRVEAAANVAASHHLSMEWEIGCLSAALREVHASLVLLKGAAYLAARLPYSDARLYGDVDILVPEDKLAVITAALQRHGWLFEQKDEYDQRFYREWSHELPPMRNAYRFTNLDMHFTIFPRKGRYQPNPELLLREKRASGLASEVYTLCSEDMVLHCATHQFGDGEFDRGLRNLVDLRGLLQTYAGKQDFWERLLERAQLLGLQEPLYLALSALQSILNHELPEVIQDHVRRWLQQSWRHQVVAKCFKLATTPQHPSCLGVTTRLARFVLYLRGHHLRLPLHLLVPHLVRKSYLQWTNGKQREEQEFQG